MIPNSYRLNCLLKVFSLNGLRQESGILVPLCPTLVPQLRGREVVVRIEDTGVARRKTAVFQKLFLRSRADANLTLNRNTKFQRTARIKTAAARSVPQIGRSVNVQI